MKIGFDLDKIFIVYPPLIPDRLIDRLYRKKTSGKLLYRIPSRPEQAVRRLSHISFFRPPIQKNITFLKSLTAKNHELYLISSRFQFLESATTALLRKYGFDVETEMEWEKGLKWPGERGETWRKVEAYKSGRAALVGR